MAVKITVWMICGACFGFLAQAWPADDGSHVTRSCNHSLTCQFEEGSCGFRDSPNWVLEHSDSGSYQRYEYRDGTDRDLISPSLCHGAIDVTFSCLIITNKVTGLDAELHVLTNCGPGNSHGHQFAVRGPLTSWRKFRTTLPACPGIKSQRVVFRTFYALPGSIILLDNVRLQTVAADHVSTRHNMKPTSTRRPAVTKTHTRPPKPTSNHPKYTSSRSGVPMSTRISTTTAAAPKVTSTVSKTITPSASASTPSTSAGTSQTHPANTFLIHSSASTIKQMVNVTTQQPSGTTPRHTVISTSRHLVNTTLKQNVSITPTHSADITHNMHSTGTSRKHSIGTTGSLPLSTTQKTSAGTSTKHSVGPVSSHSVITTPQHHTKHSMNMSTNHFRDTTLQRSSGTTTAERPASTTDNSRKGTVSPQSVSNNHKKRITIGVAVGVCATVLVIFLVILVYRRTKSVGKVEDEDNLIKMNQRWNHAVSEY